MLEALVEAVFDHIVHPSSNHIQPTPITNSTLNLRFFMRQFLKNLQRSTPFRTCPGQRTAWVAVMPSTLTSWSAAPSQSRDWTFQMNVFKT